MAAPRLIDIHSHFFPHSWPDLSARFGGDWPWMRHEGARRATVMIGDRPFRPVYDACWDMAVRLEEMDRHGVDHQIMCATPVLFAYDRPVDQAAEVARIFNDAAIELREQGRGRIDVLCQVPLQDGDAACRELERAMAAGHVGVQIGNHVGDRDLDDESILAFLQHCASLGAAVLVHPWDMIGTGSPRMRDYMLPWLVGMPAETQLSILRLILSGAFERLPRDLRICFAHGGGSFPYLLGRAENAWRERDIVRKDCPHPPSHYLDRFHVDAAVFDAGALKLLVDVMGEDRVLFGTDYPFPLGEKEMGALVLGSTLDDAVKAKILAGNASRFFGLEERRVLVGA
ncbi:aminocarboxymuconate-semialdehyde decarboxylase [Rhizorhabdus wittichii DC-6]|nr:aminocarboxymuconate-semialdehyde decarboxylase [Rhizorhabdus wittichii DC-6]